MQIISNYLEEADFGPPFTVPKYNFSLFGDRGIIGRVVFVPTFGHTTEHVLN